MKKQIKRIGALLLAGIMAFSFAGCGGNVGSGSGAGGNANTGTQIEKQTGVDGETEAKGCYVEKELVTPEGLKKLTNLTRVADGSLVILDMENGMRHVSKDEGQSWESSEIPILCELIRNKSDTAGIEILAHAVCEDGSMFFGFNNWGEDFETGTFPTHYYYVDTEGNATERMISLERKSDYLTEAAFAEDGTLYAMNMDGQMYRVDIEAQSAEYLFEPKSLINLEMGICGNSLVLTDKGQAYFRNQDGAGVDMGDTVLNTWVQKENEKDTSIVMAGDGEKIYLASVSGIYSHVLGGSVMEQIVDGTLFLMGEPERRACALLAGEDGSFLIGYEDGIICSYIYDENASAVPKKQLNVYSLEENATVRAAIVAFRKKNPDVYVKLEVGMSGVDSMTANDAIKNLNARMLAGEAPDILLLDGIPAASYIEKGVLLDISDVLNETGGEEEYFTNLFKAYQRENKTYAVPLRFQIPMLTGRAEELEGMTDLESLADRVENVRASNEEAATILGSYTAEELLYQLTITNGNTWLLENGEADKEALQAFFTQAKRIYQAEQEKLTTEIKELHNRAMELGATSIEERWQKLWDNAFDILYGRTAFGMGNISNAECYPRTIATLKELENGTIIALPGEDKQVFIPSGIVGITSESREVKLAGEFLKELLSMTVQKKDTKDGLPVNREAYESWTKQENSTIDEEISVAAGDESGRVVSVSYDIWPSDAQWDALLSIVEGLEQPCLMDETILDSVTTIGEEILVGNKSIEDGVNEIMQKINIYSKE